MKKLIVAATAVIMLCLSVNAATVAYWRLEEGPNGSTHTTDLDGYYTDTSGNGNAMSSWYRPAPVGDVPFATVPSSGATNQVALSFLRQKNMCLGTYDNSKPIESYSFVNGWTMEASFKHSFRRREWSVILGKDDAGTPGSDPPFFFKVRLYTSGGPAWEDGRLVAFTCDDAGNNREIVSINPIDKEKWYSAAATFDPVTSNMNFYLKGEEDSDYVLQGTITDIPGASIQTWGTNNWTIARGMYNSGASDYISASIDEVRVTAEPLAVNQFLASTGGVAPSPLAYWRFEEGTNGVHNADMDNYYVDSSGNGNHMSTPVLNQERIVATNEVPFTIVPQTGAADTMAREYSGWGAVGGQQNVGTFSYQTSAKSVESNPFDNGFTVECMAKPDATGWQVIVAKNGFDAYPHSGWVDPNLAVKFRDDNQHVHFHFFDGNTNFVTLESTFAAVVGEWYQIAAVCAGGTQALLYVKRESDVVYGLEGSTTLAYSSLGNTNLPIEGGLLDVTRPWTIGRGMYWGGPTDPFNGIIDEVRISDAGLPPTEFLGIVPEPGMVIAGIAFALLALRRK